MSDVPKANSQGLARVAVKVAKDDRDLILRVAAELRDPTRAPACREAMRAIVGPRLAMGLKALLASAPLEGVDLTRQRDFDRPDQF